MSKRRLKGDGDALRKPIEIYFELNFSTYSQSVKFYNENNLEKMLPHDEYYDEMTEEEKLFEKKVTARIKLIEEEHVRENEL